MSTLNWSTFDYADARNVNNKFVGSYQPVKADTSTLCGGGLCGNPNMPEYTLNTKLKSVQECTPKNCSIELRNDTVDLVGLRNGNGISNGNGMARQWQWQWKWQWQ